MRCSYCGRDLNEIWQDNMSSDNSKIVCEDCYWGSADCNEPTMEAILADIDYNNFMKYNEGENKGEEENKEV